ncbi:helix-turn-helix domain-containing protein [Serratia marcescens]
MRLQQVLDELGLNQSELGRRLGVKPQSVQGWLKGVMPRMDKLEALSEITGRPVYWFFLSPEDEEGLGSPAKEKQLSDKQKELIDLFDQLPTQEQDNMIAAFSARLKELDSFVQQYLQRRKNLHSE